LLLPSAGNAVDGSSHADGVPFTLTHVFDLLAPTLPEFWQSSIPDSVVVWIESQRDEWHGWLTMVRERRNAFHAFHHRELGTWDEFRQAVIRYHEFVTELDRRVPYPKAGDYE
jgi:hypothetical protein